MKVILLFITSLFAAMLTMGQPYLYPMPDYTPSISNSNEREHFQDMKFGLFIHWGIYSQLGDGEWVMHQEKIPYDNYKKLAAFFYPQKFNAKEWVAIAKAAGMKYITITTRHHDGFSMFKTAASKYNIVDATPYGKDPLMELAIECKRENIGLHFYYSLLDWGRPDYGFGQQIVNGVPEKTDWDSYIAFMKAQLTELIINYPAVKAIWFDGNWERTNVNWHYNEIYALIHKLDPTIMIGNNHHMGPLKGEDFQMFEKDLPGENTTGFSKDPIIGKLPLETCETINNSWGFNIKDNNYKSVKQIIHYLVNAAGRNANFLLNVGPMPNGKIQSEFVDTLKLVGKWMSENGESIYSTRADVVPPQPWGVVTQKRNFIYCHILHPFTSNEIFIPIIKGKKVLNAKLFNFDKTLKIRNTSLGYYINIQNEKISDIDTIVKLTIQ